MKRYSPVEIICFTTGNDSVNLNTESGSPEIQEHCLTSALCNAVMIANGSRMAE